MMAHALRVQSCHWLVSAGPMSKQGEVSGLDTPFRAAVIFQYMQPFGSSLHSTNNRHGSLADILLDVAKL